MQYSRLDMGISCMLGTHSNQPSSIFTLLFAFKTCPEQPCARWSMIGKS